MSWIKEAVRRGDAIQAGIKKLSEKGGNLRISKVGAPSNVEGGVAEAVVKGRSIKIKVAPGLTEKVTPKVTLIRMGDGSIMVQPGGHEGVPQLGLVNAGILYLNEIGEILEGLEEARDNLRNKD